MAVPGAESAQPAAAEVSEKVAEAAYEDGHQRLSAEAHGAVDVLFDVDLGWDKKEGEANAVEKNSGEQSGHGVSGKEHVAQEACEDCPQEKGAEFKTAEQGGERVHGDGLGNLAKGHGGTDGFKAEVVQVKCRERIKSGKRYT